MDSLGIIFKGLILGFSIAAPVGPIGVLCIRRTLDKGFKSGVVSGLGAASADAVYGTIAAAGLTLIADFLVRQEMWLGLLGGAFLLYLGLNTFFAKANAEAAKVEDSKNNSLAKDYFSTFLLTLSNPMTIFSFIAIFSGFSAQSGAVFKFSAFLLVLGVFCGSALWWLTLSILVNVLRQKLDQRIIFYINKAAAVVIIAFAVYLIYQALM
jgi:threonine/homoserine/homoserine lactone efflux protein